MFLSNTRFSSTSFNAELYILMEIRYCTDNPSNIRRILTVYHTHVTQDHKWIFTILYKVTKTDSVGNKIICMKLVPWIASTATFIPPLNAGSMALGSTTCRQRHRVGKGGEQGPEQEGERTGGTGVTGNRQGTETGKSGVEEEAKGGVKKKGSLWWGVFKPTGDSTKEEVPMRFGTYNIRNGRNRVLESALRGMSQANMDLGIFQETKCIDGIYTRNSAGYRVVATDSPSRHRGGVELFNRPPPLF